MTFLQLYPFVELALINRRDILVYRALLQFSLHLFMVNVIKVVFLVFLT
jgi:hypothetical protein